MTSDVQCDVLFILWRHLKFVSGMKITYQILLFVEEHP